MWVGLSGEILWSLQVIGWPWQVVRYRQWVIRGLVAVSQQNDGDWAMCLSSPRKLAGQGFKEVSRSL